MSLSKNLKDKGVKSPKGTSRGGPVWEGPEGDGPNGGITQSLLNRFLTCRERFRLVVVEGLKPVDTFNHRIEYGQMWHVCEEAHAKSKKPPVKWEYSLRDYCSNLCKRYPVQQEQVDHWYNVCKTQFPVYIDFWSKHPDVKNRAPLMEEQVFDVIYKIPSGRKVRLRGKWDSVDLVTDNKTTSLWLQENKTKGDIRQQQLLRQLTFDLQTMFYTVALVQWRENEVRSRSKNVDPSWVFRGVRYNVIRRPLSGGKGSIVRHKPTKTNPDGESKAEFYGRLEAIIREQPEDFFMRWNVEITSGDIAKFRQEFLDPILEQLCRWWDWVSSKGSNSPFEYDIHWRHPFGCVNFLDEGGVTDLDEYLASGSTVGLRRINSLFGELG